MRPLRLSKNPNLKLVGVRGVTLAVAANQSWAQEQQQAQCPDRWHWSLDYTKNQSRDDKA
jgi:hypothetical protein